MSLRSIPTVFLAALSFLTACSGAASFDHTHAAFTEVLAARVKGAKVDYAGLKQSPAGLNSYLGTLAAVKKSEYDKWSTNERMAFLINVYNANTLKLVVDNYPVKSIKNIGGVFKGPWKQEVVSLWGSKVTLDHVEHGLLRPSFNEPRVHFAVNCASIGCPNLLNEAFQASNLEAQLDRQTRTFLADTTRNSLDARKKTLNLSPIFKWFEEDFVKKSGSVAGFVAPYFKDHQALLQGGGVKIKYTNYSWDLNGN